jgi:hypothetical protein
MVLLGDVEETTATVWISQLVKVSSRSSGIFKLLRLSLTHYLRLDCAYIRILFQK